MICINSVNKSYGDNTIYRDFSLEIPDGKITCLLGENGSGKTTLLKMISSLTDYEGEISGAGKVSFLFQENALFPNLTVEQNIFLVSEKERAEKMIKKFGLTDLKEKYPSSLSGGEKKRVAFCRALAFDGDTFLLDEPFSSLDTFWKIELLREYAAFQKQGKKTTLFVTHSVDEALYLADNILLLKDGKVRKQFENTRSASFGDEHPLRKTLISLLAERETGKNSQKE